MLGSCCYDKMFIRALLRREVVASENGKPQALKSFQQSVVAMIQRCLVELCSGVSTFLLCKNVFSSFAQAISCCR